jgi:transposase
MSIGCAKREPSNQHVKFSHMKPPLFDVASGNVSSRKLGFEIRSDVHRPAIGSRIWPQCWDYSPCVIGLEACGSAHHWARELVKLGHDARLMPPNYVKAYVRRQKNDAADAAAICEAVGRPSCGSCRYGRSAIKLF